MESYLKQLEHRFVKYSDSQFSFSLLKSTNIFYLYWDTNNINGQLNMTFEFKESPLNIKNHKNIPKISSDKIVCNQDQTIFKSLFEGIWDKDTFYFTDIHVHNGIVLNHNYKTRYLLLKKILNSFAKNESFSIIKNFSGTSLEQIITEIIPQQPFKVQYVLMKKNFSQYLLNVENKEEQKQEQKQTIKIEQWIEKPIKESLKVKIYATQKQEIYLVEHKKCDFFSFNSFWHQKFKDTDTFYSVLRVPDVKTSQYLKEHFVSHKQLEIECNYNPRFKKFEFNKN